MLLRGSLTTENVQPVSYRRQPRHEQPSAAMLKAEGPAAGGTTRPIKSKSFLESMGWEAYASISAALVEPLILH